MFLSCGSLVTAGSGSSTNIINNYLNAPLNTINFSTAPFYSNHVEISGAPILAPPFITGTFTITMRELSVFSAAVFDSFGGANSMVFRDLAGAVIKTINVATLIVSDNIIFKSVDITIPGAFLSLFTWQTVPAYTTQKFTVAGEVIQFYPLFWQNSTSDGSTVSSTAAGNIVVQAYTPFVPYTAEFTGTVYLYDQNGLLVYTGNYMQYPNPVWRMEIDGTISSLSYLAFWSEPTTYDTYAVSENHIFYIDGTTIYFRQPTFVRNIVGAVSSVNGHPIAAPAGISQTILAESIVGTITQIDCEPRTLFLEDGGPYTNLDFTALSNGEINIENDYYLVRSADQLNNPAMISAQNVIYSADANSLVPFADAGTITIYFKQSTLIKEIYFTPTTTGTIIVGAKTYPIESTVRPRDFINRDSMRANTVYINFTNGGALTGMLISAVLPEYYDRDSQNYIIEDFGTKTVEFAASIVDTNIASAIGTPNTIFAGPGIGLGGGPGNGQNNVYLGGATQDDIVFDRDRWVESILFINCRIGYRVDLFDAAATLIDSIYIGNFGQNSVHRTYIRKKVKSIVLIGDLAIAEITYGAAYRLVVGLPDNASTAAPIAGTLTGNYTFSITGDSVCTAILANGNSLTNGTSISNASAAPSGEIVHAQWLAGQPPEIFHFITKTGGTGDMLYYVVRAIG
jgi:hypothetical protein